MAVWSLLLQDDSEGPTFIFCTAHALQRFLTQAVRFIFGVAPIDYSPVLLLMPFGFHLAMDTLPSGELQVLGFRSALACVRVSLSCPFKLLHTFHLPRPTRHYPRLRIQRSSFERRRDFNPPEQRAAQRTLRGSPPLIGVSVLSALQGYCLSLFPSQHRSSSQVPYRSPDESHAACTPDTV